jgi:EAL and modified HD-GYP domain-containing signal transduction protein
MDAVLGQSDGFFNVNREVLLSDAIEALPREPLLPWANIVKVDLPAVPARDLRKLVRSLREHDVLLLAEKVETADEFEHCHKLGLNLLRLVNTAGKATRVQLESIDDAVRHIGLQQLGRWVSILLYVQGDGSDFRSPLLLTAAHRGRLMELVVGHSLSRADAESKRERAFLVGMLSLADALLGRSIEALVCELRLGVEIARALTHHEGELGDLLTLAETVEQCQLDKFEAGLARWDLDLAGLQQLVHDAYAWVHGLVAPGAVGRCAMKSLGYS